MSVPCRHVHGGEAAERAVVDDIRIGDRQDDARAALAEPLVEQRLQVDHVGRLVGPVLVVHAVVGGGDDVAAELIEPGQ